jgi:hypothetical protein
VKWSPAGDKVAVAIKPSASAHLQLYLFTPDVAIASLVTAHPLSSVIADAFIWQSSGHALLVSTIPPSRGAPPAAPLLPRGPSIQVRWRNLCKRVNVFC